MEAFHVNSSLPRSGSELMQALLNQHPSVYASPTSPLLEYWAGCQGARNTQEARSQVPELMDRAMKGAMRGALVGYYEQITNSPVVVDKSRGWLEWADLLWELIPNAKIVCMVRKVDDIIASMERVYRANPGHPETRNLPKTPELRAQFWLQNGQIPVGVALNRLQDRRERGEDIRVRYIDYDQLVDYPVEVMQNVFQFLSLPDFKVDPNNIEHNTHEINNQAFGIFGNHTVRKVVARRGQQPIFKQPEVSVEPQKEEKPAEAKVAKKKVAKKVSKKASKKKKPSE